MTVTVEASARSSCEQTHAKRCSKCGQEKPLTNFSKSARGLMGRRGDCKTCHAVHKAAHRLANLEEHKAKAREKYWRDPHAARGWTRSWRLRNSDKAKAREREYKEKNRELIRQKDRERIAATRDARNAKQRDRRAMDPERYREYVKRWQKENPDKVRVMRRRRIATPRGALTNTVRAAVHRGLTHGGKSGKRTFEALGYSVDDLMAHLERQFLRGMSWQNYGQWHVDHIRPLASFVFETVDDPGFREAWAITNLRPLWADENRQKSARRIFLL